MEIRSALGVLLRFCSVALLLLPVAAQAAFPAVIDSDVAIQFNGPSKVGSSTYGTFASEGWLHLAPAKNSQVIYVGTFTDNLGGGASFAARADLTEASAPVLQLMTRYGKIVFIMDASFGGASYFNQSVKVKPAAFAQSTFGSLSGQTHAYTTLHYSLTLDMRVGFSGGTAYTGGMTLSLIQDSFSFIAPRDPVTRAVSSLTVPKAPKPTFTKLTAPGYYGTYYVNGYNADGIHLTVNYFGRNVSLTGTHTATMNSLDFQGDAVISGVRTAAAIGTFSLVQQQ